VRLGHCIDQARQVRQILLCGWPAAAVEVEDMQRRRSGDGVDIVEGDPDVVFGNRGVEGELVRGSVQGALEDVGRDADDAAVPIHRAAGTGEDVPSRRVIDPHSDFGQDRSDGFIERV